MSARKKRVIQDDDDDEDDDDDGGGGGDDDGVAEVTEGAPLHAVTATHRPSHQEDEEDEEEEDEESDASARRLDAEDERWVELNASGRWTRLRASRSLRCMSCGAPLDGSQVLRFNLSTLRARSAGRVALATALSHLGSMALRAQIVRNASVPSTLCARVAAARAKAGSGRRASCTT